MRDALATRRKFIQFDETVRTLLSGVAVPVLALASRAILAVCGRNLDSEAANWIFAAVCFAAALIATQAVIRLAEKWVNARLATRQARSLVHFVNEAAAAVMVIGFILPMAILLIAAVGYITIQAVF